MDETPSTRSLVVVAGLLVGALVLAVTVMTGGQSTKILSTVGSAVNTPVDGAAQPEPAATPKPTNAGQVADAANTPPTLLIIRTGSLEVEVADLDVALRSADAAVARAGGYISGSNRAAAGDDRVAESTYRIPSVAWDSTLEVLRSVASRVRSEVVETEEVTGQVVDLTARIANLRATESALQAIMAKASRISDVLDVQSQLTDTRGEIERLVADKAHLQDQASYGSLTMTFRLPAAPAPTVTPRPVKGWDPGTDVANATGRLVRIGQATTTAGIWVAIVGLPLLVGATILLFVGWQVVRLGRWLVARRAATLDLTG